MLDLSKARPMSCNIVLFTILVLSQVSTATLSLQDLQPIAHFPPACEAAYETPIPQCPPASSFSLTSSGSGSSPCSQDCFNALNKATSNIQAACQGTAAPPGTVIAHAFYGDLATWLCSLGSGGSQPASATNPGSATSTAGSTGSASAISTDNTSQNTVGSTSSPSSSASSSTESASSSGSTSASSSTSTSESSLTTISTHTSKSKSSTTKAPTSTFIPNGGSPFDQTVAPNAAPSPVHGQNVLLAAGVVFAVAVGS